MGVYPSGTDALSDAMAADLEACGFRADSDPDVMTKKRGKMLMNLGSPSDATRFPYRSVAPLLILALSARDS